MKTRLSILLLLSSIGAFAQSGRITRIVSAASGAPTIAPDSLATIYGENLTGTSDAGQPPYPLVLANIGITIVSSNVSTAIHLVFASPTQITFVVPNDVTPGAATVFVGSRQGLVAIGDATVEATAPAIFTANGTGSGAAAGLAIRTVLPTDRQGIVSIFRCGPITITCQAIPIDLGIDAPVTLILFGTGIRAGKSITATIGGQSARVDYAGAQSEYPGLDQINIPLFLNLRGAGLVDVVLTVDGKPSNPVQISIQ